MSGSRNPLQSGPTNLNESHVYASDTADEDEAERLAKQNLVFKLCRGGKNYVGPVEEVLRPRPSYVRTVLDLGCSSSAWGVASDMALEFPHCDMLGLDNAPQVPANKPQNYRVEVRDLNLGPHHLTQDFDLVHTRVINTGIKDFHQLVEEISSILRPNGLILLQEWDYKLYGEDKEIPLTQTSGKDNWHHSWVIRWAYLLRQAVLARGGDVDCPPLMQKWLEDYSDVDEIGRKDVYIPVAPFFPDTEENKTINKAGALFREDIQFAFQTTVKPAVLANGVPLDEYQEVVDNATAEMNRAEWPPIYFRIFCVWGRKKDMKKT